MRWPSRAAPECDDATIDIAKTKFLNSQVYSAAAPHINRASPMTLLVEVYNPFCPQIRRSIAPWRPLAPFTALCVLLILFAGSGMLVIASEADRSDASRAREAAMRTLAGMRVRLDSAAEMNAAAPPIASAPSGSRATPVSA